MRDALSVPLEKTVVFPPHPLRCAQHLLGKEKAARTPTAPAGRKLRTRIAPPVPPEAFTVRRAALEVTVAPPSETTQRYWLPLMAVVVPETTQLAPVAPEMAVQAPLAVLLSHW